MKYLTEFDLYIVYNIVYVYMFHAKIVFKDDMKRW